MDRKKQEGADFKPLANDFLIGVSVLVYTIGLIADKTGTGAGVLYQNGALYAPLLLRGMGLHRLVTSIFLHADPMHLMNNVVVQFAGGEVVERNLGHVRFALLFLLSGIGGNAASVLSDYVTGSYGFSVGASGAVFGIIGALLFMILREALGFLRRRDPVEEESRAAYRRGGPGAQKEGGLRRRALPPRMKSLLLRAVIMTGYLLYSGWKNPVVNQAAHIGGLVTGFLLAVFLMPREGADLELLDR